jgi:transcriptional regulator with XRE-family HTH domain
MTGLQIKAARKSKGWTQRQAARKLGMTQAYLSMLENGRRRFSPSAANRLAKKLDLPPTALPLSAPSPWSSSPSDLLSRDLAALGYPGFSYLNAGPTVRRNPALVLFDALNQPDLDMRVVEGLPWLACTFAELDWSWLISNAKLHDRQNRLGFTVSLARELAIRGNRTEPAATLAAAEDLLRASLLAREDTLCHDSVTQAEREWLRLHRSAQARDWNILSDLTVDQLSHAHS